MSDRLFAPPGPQVTPAESRGRRAASLAAQGQLPMAAETAPPAACPACTSTDPDHACPGEALTLEIR